jgi:hypothetical protein
MDGNVRVLFNSLNGVLQAVKTLIVRLLQRVFGAVIRFLPPTWVAPLFLLIPFVFPHRLLGMTIVELLFQRELIISAKDYAQGLYDRKKTLWTAFVSIYCDVEAGDFDSAQTKVDWAGEFRESRKTKSANDLRQSIQALETLIAIERGEVDVNKGSSVLFGLQILNDYAYRHAWRAHSMRQSDDVQRYVALYCTSIGYEPESTIYICEHILQPNDLWSEIRRILDEVRNTIKERVRRDPGVVARRKTTEVSLDRRISALMGFSYINEGDYDKVEALLAGPDGETAELRFVAAMYYAMIGQTTDASDALLFGMRNARITKDNAGFLARQIGFVGIAFEAAGEFPIAREHYKRAYQLSGIPFYLPEAVWRYVSYLTAFGKWGAAANLLEQGLYAIWASYNRLAKKSLTKRLRQGVLLPARGALILGGSGVGDELLRLGMLRPLMKDNARYGYVVDQRVQRLFESSCKNLKAYTVSSTVGYNAVSRSQYWQDRAGLPAFVDRMRLTSEVYRARKHYADVIISEDLMYNYFAQGGNFRGVTEPLLIPLQSNAEKAKAWLDTLPAGKKVGISWRSGALGIDRSPCYTMIEQWGDVLKQKHIRFVLLQYSNDPADLASELEYARENFGCVIHTMADVDLKNDFEMVVALSSQLDLVIAPGTTLRETTGAAGVLTWTLSTTPFLPDLWRIDPADGETDLIFPSMKHLSCQRYGNSEAALAEIARRFAGPEWNANLLSDHVDADNVEPIRSLAVAS